MGAETRASATVSSPSLSGTADRPSAQSDYRADIQGLRAIAVGLVVIFHLWPRRLSGGYVGVDVFFVISGFLITSHIMREVLSTGTLAVRRFWARRIRRLLPASLLVLALSGAAALVILPSTVLVETGKQIAASALYVENWQLARSAVDYMAADNDPTVAQHYWSLSVEEQFYLVWPLLLLALLGRDMAGRVRTAAAVRRRVALGLGTVVVVSLCWSVFSTPRDAGFAYFSTFTRAWEFGAGALLGAVPLALRGRAGRVAGWSGVAFIIAAGVAFSGSTVFPGWVALLPVLGSVLVIAARPEGPASVGHWLGLRPMRFIGDISYSIYLVHWPLIILGAHLVGAHLTWRHKLVLLALTVVLAWASKVWVEDPLRRGPLLGRRPRNAFVFAALGMACVAAPALAIPKQPDGSGASRAASAALNQDIACQGPSALLTAGCNPVSGRGPLLVSAEEVAAERGIARACQAILDSPKLATCVLGDPQGRNGTVALVGDSHASAWGPTLDELGRLRGWRVIVHTKSSCPFSLARRVLPTESSAARAEACEAFNATVVDALHRERPQLLFVGARAGAYGWTSVPGRSLADPAIDGFTFAWTAVMSEPGSVIVLRAVPDPVASTIVPNCVLAHSDDLVACSAARSAAIRPDPQQAAAALTPLARVVDLTDAFCDATTCHHVIGDVIVYRDKSHLSDTYARLLARPVDIRLRALGVR